MSSLELSTLRSQLEGLLPARAAPASTQGAGAAAPFIQQISAYLPLITDLAGVVGTASDKRAVPRLNKPRRRNLDEDQSATSGRSSSALRFSAQLTRSAASRSRASPRPRRSAARSGSRAKPGGPVSAWRNGPGGEFAADSDGFRLLVWPGDHGAASFTVLRRQYGRGSPFGTVGHGTAANVPTAMRLAEQMARQVGLTAETHLGQDEQACCKVGCAD